MEIDKQRKVLKYMLWCTYRAEKHKKQLNNRLSVINIGSQFSAETRILRQKKEIEQAIAQVMDILDYLPINSMEREICELRHIDLKSWREISEEIPMSRSQVNRRYKTAINILLTSKRIQEMVIEHEAEYDLYIQKKRTEAIKLTGK